MAAGPNDQLSYYLLIFKSCESLQASANPEEFFEAKP